jgi:K+-sensing histidine kinase KdpD
MGRELVSTRGIDSIARAVVRHVGEVFDSAVAVLLPDAGRLSVQAAWPAWLFDLKEQSVAQWAYDHSQMAGLNTSTCPPLKGCTGR